MKKSKMPTVWISSCPSHIRGSVARDQFSVLRYKLAEISTLVPWAVDNIFWVPDENMTRSYEQRMEIVRSVDLVVALYPTNDGSDSRQEEVKERLLSEKPIFVAKHVSVNFSKFFTGMFESKLTEITEYLYFPDLIHPIKVRLDEIKDRLDKRQVLP